MNESKCDGRCCRSFKVGNGMSRADIVQRALASGDEEEAKVAAMMRPLVGEIETPSGKRVWAVEADHWYTCAHYDPKLTACGIYDERPRMCRSHGETYPCTTAGCTLVNIQHARRNAEARAFTGVVA